METGAYSLFVDESGNPDFNSKLKPDAAYCSCVFCVPTEHVPHARDLIPRRTDGSLIKSTDIEVTDEVAAKFIYSLFTKTRSFTAVVTGACNDLVNEALFKRIKSELHPQLVKKYKTKPIDVIRHFVTAQGVSTLLQLERLKRRLKSIDIVVDRGPESPQYSEAYRALWTKPRPELLITGFRFSSRFDEPLLMSSDWIAGAIRRIHAKSDQPKTQDLLKRLGRTRRLAERSGFSVLLPPKPT